MATIYIVSHREQGANLRTFGLTQGLGLPLPGSAYKVTTGAASKLQSTRKSANVLRFTFCLLS
jgi:hypothetical protein